MSVTTTHPSCVTFTLVTSSPGVPYAIQLWPVPFPAGYTFTPYFASSVIPATIALVPPPPAANSAPPLPMGSATHDAHP